MHSNYDNVDLEEMYQDAMLATTMFDAPILEQTLTALHDALSRKQAEVNTRPSSPGETESVWILCSEEEPEDKYDDYGDGYLTTVHFPNSPTTKYKVRTQHYIGGYWIEYRKDTVAWMKRPAPYIQPPSELGGEAERNRGGADE